MNLIWRVEWQLPRTKHCNVRHVQSNQSIGNNRSLHQSLPATDIYVNQYIDQMIYWFLQRSISILIYKSIVYWSIFMDLYTNLYITIHMQINIWMYRSIYIDWYPWGEMKVQFGTSFEMKFCTSFSTSRYGPSPARRAAPRHPVVLGTYHLMYVRLGSHMGSVS